jgi:hypothetical protein
VPDQGGHVGLDDERSAAGLVDYKALLENLGTGRKEDDGGVLHARIGPHIFEEGDAIHARHPCVQNDEVRLHFRYRRLRGEAIGTSGDFISLL